MKDRPVSSIHNHSAFSLQDGISTPEELVAAAKAKGLKSVALTDHGHMHGTGRFYLAAKKAGVKGILGMEAYCLDDLQEWRDMKDRLSLEKRERKAAKKSEPVLDETDAEAADDLDLEAAAQDKAARRVLYRKGHLVLVAQNRKGLANLYELGFKAHKHGYFQKPRLDLRTLDEHSEGVVASSACMGGVISQRIGQFTRGECEWSDVSRTASQYAEVFPGRFFLELQSNEADYQKVVNEHLVRLHRETGLPLVVTMDAHYVRPEDWQAQQILHLH